LVGDASRAQPARLAPASKRIAHLMVDADLAAQLAEIAAP
jgi:hypothetical protein